jgi:hypothetical protein
MSGEALNEAWKELIATALRRNVVVAVGEHRAAVEAAAALAAPSTPEPSGHPTDAFVQQAMRFTPASRSPSPREPPHPPRARLRRGQHLVWRVSTSAACPTRRSPTASRLSHDPNGQAPRGLEAIRPRPCREYARLAKSHRASRATGTELAAVVGSSRRPLPTGPRRCGGIAATRGEAPVDPKPSQRNRLLLLAVVMAQALDLAWHVRCAMPRANEVNPSPAGCTPRRHGSPRRCSWSWWSPSSRRCVPATPPWARRWRSLALAAGCIGAGSKTWAVIALAVLTTLAAETPRSVQEPAPIASDAKGIEQGESSPAAPGRFPAPPAPAWSPHAAGGRVLPGRGPSRLVALEVRAGTRRSRELVPGARQRRGRGARPAPRPRAPLAGDVGPGDRGRPLGARSASDWCQCYRGQRTERIIDLSDDDFAVLAPLSAGLIVVRVGSVRLVPPATDR